ncbi:MAG: precorrin-6y C5,15-methyltransferase (decarboxylating) subunit CbiE [Deltaproteobacteria bacterium]|nr:precorrin-6y C5,15-methyltransferase (decarboxylating) subunit CbiE [Deltaproteobacteria bacterium]
MAGVVVVGAGVQGQEGFSRKALEAVGQAEVLAGRPHHLALFPDFPGEKVVFHDGPAEIMEFLRTTERKVAVLSSGDPLFFGLGSQLLRNLPEELLEFVPNVSSVQYAFAKIRIPWEDAVFVSLIGRDLRTEIDRIVAADKVAVLTDRVNTPQAVAAELSALGREGYKVFLCENLGSERERIVVTNVCGLRDMKAADPNLAIFIREYDGGGEPCRPVLGVADEEFRLPRHIITPEEIRVLVLAKLRLRQGDTLWDIGAGSGSVSIEADNLTRSGRIFAIEKDPERVELLRGNLRRLHCRKVVVVAGSAPDCLEQLPDPDRVFVGGSGGRLQEVLEAVEARLRPGGRVVVNAAALETLFVASEFFEKAGCRLEVTAVNISRTNPATDYKVFEPLPPVHLILAEKL